jgi:hypothetical protein
MLLDLALGDRCADRALRYQRLFAVREMPPADNAIGLAYSVTDAVEKRRPRHGGCRNSSRDHGLERCCFSRLTSCGDQLRTSVTAIPWVDVVGDDELGGLLVHQRVKRRDLGEKAVTIRMRVPAPQRPMIIAALHPRLMVNRLPVAPTGTPLERPDSSGR